jgi:serine phosphatase RsbU (regulator of sigma subunit)
VAELSTSGLQRAWRRLGALTRAFGGREDQRQFWQSTTRAGRVTIALAIFSLFAALGLLTDVTELGRSSLGRVVLATLLSGGGAVALVLVAFSNMRWMPAVLAVYVMLVVLLPRLLPLEPPIVADPGAATLLEARLRTNVLGAAFCIAAAFTFFMMFFAREGSRYYALHTELSLARAIHRELVPAISRQIGDYEFHGVSIPSGEVGGDLVDLVDHDEGAAWTAYVTDVSGHGVPSGVLMGMIKSAMRMALVSPPPLEALLDRLNDVLYELKPPQMYATFAAIRRDGGEQLAFTLAGHLPILCWRAATGTVEELVVGQVPLGILPGRTFEASRTSCAPGDVMLVLTDGLTEVFDADDEEFGMERVHGVLAAHAKAPLAEIELKLLAAARAHGTPHDDQSLILIRRTA